MFSILEGINRSNGKIVVEASFFTRIFFWTDQMLRFFQRKFVSRVIWMKYATNRSSLTSDWFIPVALIRIEYTLNNSIRNWDRIGELVWRTMIQFHRVTGIKRKRRKAIINYWLITCRWISAIFVYIRDEFVRITTIPILFKPRAYTFNATTYTWKGASSIARPWSDWQVQRRKINEPRLREV